MRLCLCVVLALFLTLPPALLLPGRAFHARRQDQEWRPQPALRWGLPPSELSSFFFVSSRSSSLLRLYPLPGQQGGRKNTDGSNPLKSHSSRYAHVQCPHPVWYMYPYRRLSCDRCTCYGERKRGRYPTPGWQTRSRTYHCPKRYSPCCIFSGLFSFSRDNPPLIERPRPLQRP